MVGASSRSVVHSFPGAPPDALATSQTAGMHPLLRAAAERQLGLFTAADARRAGYEQPEIQRLCASGTWRRIRRGVYITAEGLTTAEEKGRRHQVDCLAVLLELSRPTAVISHESAARIWGFPVRRSLLGPIRLTDPTLSRRGRDYRLTQAPLRPGEVARSGPFRLTAVGRTLLDCARQWELEDAVVALDAALLATRVTPAQLIQGAAALRGWPGAHRAARAVSLADGRAESPLETSGRLRILGAGFPVPELQVEIHSTGRRVAVVDAWFDEQAVAVEFDGRIKYTDPWGERSPERVLWDEKRREDELRAVDIRVVRIAQADLGPAWPRTESRLRELLASPGPAIRRFTTRPRARGRQRSG
jgi:Transcriptional regulator, AbiEi antitoxin